MAESTLSLTYSDVQYEVGKFLGWDRTAASWTATQNTDFTYVLKRGLRLFYFPPSQEQDKPYHEWSFLRKYANVTLVDGNSSYTLADDCGGTVLDFSATYAAGSGRPRLRSIPESELRALQSYSNQTKKWPLYYAVRNQAIANTGQRYEMLVYPTPGATQVNATISYSYVYVPNVMATDAVYPDGGGMYSEVLLSAILAAAEASIDDDPMGKHMERFGLLITAAVRDDKNKKLTGTGANL